MKQWDEEANASQMQQIESFHRSIKARSSYIPNGENDIDYQDPEEILNHQNPEVKN